MSSDSDESRLRREQAFFRQLLEEQQEIFWAELTAAAPARRQDRIRRIAEAAQLATCRRTLEIGCGTARYTELLAQHTPGSIVAIDATLLMLQRASARASANIALVGADANRLPFPDACFDAVVGNAVLHHLPLGRALAELIRVLRPSGHFAFTEPNMLNPQLLIGLHWPWLREKLQGSPDETAFVRWSLRRRLSAAGLEDISIEPFDFLHPATPERWLDTVAHWSRALERVPIVREIAGSLAIVARKRRDGS